LAQLIFTTDAFRAQGRAVPNVPFLVDDAMRLIEPACAWLLHIALVRGRTRSEETWRTYGETLYDWWCTLEANSWAWDQITASELAAYRDAMLSGVSSVTGRDYARSTINLRLRTIGQFYSWCAARGLVKQRQTLTTELQIGRYRRATFLAHTDASGGVQIANELTLRETSDLPRPLSSAAIRKLIALAQTRDRLIIEWAFSTGMRRMEIAALQLSSMPPSGEEPLVPVRLLLTKGRKPRTVYTPVSLLERTWAYVREERAVALRKLATRGAPRGADTVFISRTGKALTARRVGSIFAELADAAGIKASFHALRHTFAVNMLRLLQEEAARNPHLNPLLTLQVLMGHADLSTTAVYLRVLGCDLTDVEISIDNMYQESVE